MVHRCIALVNVACLFLLQFYLTFAISVQRYSSCLFLLFKFIDAINCV